MPWFYDPGMHIPFFILIIAWAAVGATQSVAQSSPPQRTRALRGSQTNRTLDELLWDLGNLYGSRENLIRDLRSQRVLDVGCGFSSFTAELRGAGIEAYALDCYFPPGTTRPNTVVANATDLPFATGSFTRMFASNTLYLWSRQDDDILIRALRESARVLDCEGHLVVVGSLHDQLRRLILQADIKLDVIASDERLLTFIQFRRRLRASRTD